MDFQISDEQRMLTDSVARFVQDNYGLERRRGYLAEPQSFSPENWRLLAEMGLLALALPADRGGLGGAPSDLFCVMEQLGDGLAVEPVAISAVLAMRLLSASSAHRDIAERVATGTCRVAVALSDPPATRPEPALSLRYETIDAGYRLTGTRTLAIQSVGADAVIFPCEGSGGFAAFLIDPDTIPGARRTDYRLIDGTVASEFAFAGSEVAASHRLDISLCDWARAKAWFHLANGAELCGIMAKLLSETAEYLRTRKQFGVTIGSFQSPQHQMARMLMDYEKARALMLRFAFTLENATFDSTSVESARYIAETAIALAEGCLHLHGGMGITAEAFAGQSLKRMQLLRAISC